MPGVYEHRLVFTDAEILPAYIDFRISINDMNSNGKYPGENGPARIKKGGVFLLLFCLQPCGVDERMASLG